MGKCKIGAAVVALILSFVMSDVRPAAAAAVPEEAAKFVGQLGGELVPILAGNSRTEGERELELERLIRQGFDLAVTGRFVLGRFWRRANPQQQQEYQALFEEYVVITTARRFAPFRDVDFDIVESKTVGKKDVLVKTVLTRPNVPEIPADWRVRLIGDKYRIIDVHIEGISMAVTQRQDFAAVINSRGIEGLLENLREQVAAAVRTDTSLKQ